MEPVLQDALAKQNNDSGDSLEDAGNSLIMMVDDEPILMEIVQEFLEQRGYNRFVTCEDSTIALDMIASEEPDVLLLDLVMPEVTGFDILHALRSNQETRHLPVIVLTSSADAETKLKALELGATDFLGKPVDASELSLRLRNTLTAKAYQDQLRNSDQLTGLPNRKRLRETLEWAKRKQQLDGQESELLLLGLENFKAINDTLGPASGDILLVQLAARLQSAVENLQEAHVTYLARAAGDEFAILLQGLERDQVLTFANEILREFTVPFRINGEEVHASAGIGGVSTSQVSEADELLQRAGVAQKFAKHLQRNNFQFYSAEIDAEARELLVLENDLRSALEKEELELYFQPKMDSQTKEIVGMEALIRWHRGEELVPPFRFIPIAEESGLIVSIGEWILKDACRKCKALEDAGIDVKVSVNVSAYQINDERLVAATQEALDDSGLSPAKLIVEITESVIMDDVNKSLSILNQLRDLGVMLSIDDFGTGYSSLSYLKRLPIGELKIDRSFLQSVPESQEDAAIVRAILALAHSLELIVTAEGTETIEQIEYLTEQGCELLQGFYFSKPLPIEQFKQFANSYRA